MLGKLIHLKDKGLAAGLKAALNERCKAYGRVTEVEIDSSAKVVRLGVELVGESEKVDVTLKGYAVVDTEGGTGIGTGIELGAVETSKPWMTALINDLADRLPGNRRLDIESETLARLIKVLL